jgi:hypothetical protein
MDPDRESGSGSKQAKNIRQKWKKKEIFMYDELFVGLDASHGT